MSDAVRYKSVSSILHCVVVDDQPVPLAHTSGCLVTARVRLVRLTARQRDLVLSCVDVCLVTIAVQTTTKQSTALVSTIFLFSSS